MSEPARNRFALDLDDLERQLRGAAQPQRPGANVDPLQELTRIVGQDDPLKDLFAPRAEPAPAQASQPVAENVTHLSAVRGAVQPQPAEMAEQAPPADLRGAMDEFEQLLLRRGVGRVPAGADEPDEPTLTPRDLDELAAPAAMAGNDYVAQETYPDPPIMAEEDGLPVYQPRRSRKGLWAAGALVGVVAVGAVSALAFRETVSRPSGEPPLITADQGAVKVAPANPGGTEIPNQNKQIYERSGDAPPAKAKVVSNEEQPVDVEQTARIAQPRVVLAGPGTGPAASGESPAGSPIAATNSNGLVPVPPVPGLGEPRRVRTVAIRPDGTPANQPVAEPAASVPSVVTTGSARPAAPESRQRVAAATPPSRPQDAQPAPAATTPAAPVRTASLPPAAATPAQPPAANAARSGGEGGFAIQLAAPGSEAEARATFAALQRKYPDHLGGQAPIVRRTELAGGKTVYRLRIGPYSREEASSLCSRLQGAGGQCFVAKN